MINLNNFVFVESGLAFLRLCFKRLVFKCVTQNSANYFVRLKDLISTNPQINSYHESELTSLINYISNLGWSDYLVDIGANIGLISSQCGSSFSEVVCFEPNPLCVHILKVNTEISINHPNVLINEFGLGESDELLDLWIPKKNWGGAFIQTDQNSYKSELLANKDGFDAFDESNYLKKQVQVKPAVDELSNTFNMLSNKGLKKGVIKIDIEGMEPFVISKIAETFPQDFSCAIIFENWDREFDFEALQKKFTGRKVRIGSLDQRLQYNKSWPKLLKFLALLFTNRNTYVDFTQSNGILNNDIVVIVE